ncbi:hypothetical protein [Streptomyces sp. NPDC002644]
MKRLKFETHVELTADEFEDQWDSDAGRLIWYALEHGDASGGFSSQEVGEVSIEDYEETE